MAKLAYLTYLRDGEAAAEVRDDDRGLTNPTNIMLIRTERISTPDYRARAMLLRGSYGRQWRGDRLLRPFRAPRRSPCGAERDPLGLYPGARGDRTPRQVRACLLAAAHGADARHLAARRSHGPVEDGRPHRPGGPALKSAICASSSSRPARRPTSARKAPEASRRKTAGSTVLNIAGATPSWSTMPASCISFRRGRGCARDSRDNRRSSLPVTIASRRQRFLDVGRRYQRLLCRSPTNTRSARSMRSTSSTGPCTHLPPALSHE